MSFFFCDNLLLQKFVQSLCENTFILCVNIIDPLSSGNIQENFVYQPYLRI